MPLMCWMVRVAPVDGDGMVLRVVCPLDAVLAMEALRGEAGGMTVLSSSDWP